MSETIEQKCIAKGVKLTDQRKIIAKIMSESEDHPDVDELYNRASKIDQKYINYISICMIIPSKIPDFKFMFFDFVF